MESMEKPPAVRRNRAEPHVRFSGHPDEEYKPISMIITTLSAHLYAGYSSVLLTTSAALARIVNLLSSHAALLEHKNMLQEDIASLKLIQRVGNKWYIPNPVNPHNPGDPDEKGENFADKWDRDNHARAKAFFQWVAWLKKDFDVIMNADSVEQISETLEANFGSSTAKELVRKSKGTQTSIAPVTPKTLGRFDVPHREEPKWNMKPFYGVAINGKAAINGNTWNSNAGFDPICKGADLIFEATTNVPHPYDVYWQVVNTGTEAERAYCLRGNIFPGKNVRCEATAYTGFHWVQCFIVQNGICLARSDEFVVKIQ